MSEKKISPTFCVLPWIHTHVWTDGKIFPCCMSDYRFPIGNFNDSRNIAEIMNLPRYQEMREKMIKGSKCAECRKCYELEGSGSNSMRMDSNKQYQKDVDSILSIPDCENVVLKNFKFKFLDIRFSNLCNLSCISCSPLFSNQLYKVHKLMDEHLPENEFLNLEAYEALQPYLLQVTNVNFAGGEPFINLDHYRILKFWSDNGHSNVNINYTSNMTTLSFKNFEILAYWKQFKNVSVLASLDDYGPNISAIRRGASWPVIEKNIKRIQEETPHVRIKISPTVGALNLLRVTTMIQEMYDNFGISPTDWQINILQYPDFLGIKSLPKEEKVQFLKNCNDHELWLKKLNLRDEGALASLINFVTENLEFDEELQKKRISFLEKFEKAAKEVKSQS